MSSEKPQNPEIIKSAYTIMNARLPFKISNQEKGLDKSERLDQQIEDNMGRYGHNEASFDSPELSSKKRSYGLSAESKICHSNAKLPKPQSKARGSALKDNLMNEMSDQVNDQFALYKSKVDSWKQEFEDLMLNKEMFNLDLTNLQYIGLNSVGTQLLTKYKFWTLCNVLVCERKSLELERFIQFYLNSKFHGIDSLEAYNNETILIIKDHWNEDEILVEFSKIKNNIYEYNPPTSLNETSKDDFDLLLMYNQPANPISHNPLMMVSVKLLPNEEIQSPIMRCPNVSKVSGIEQPNNQIEFTSVIKSLNQKLIQHSNIEDKNLQSPANSNKSKSSEILKKLSPFRNSSNIKPGTCRDPFSKFKKMFAPKRYDNFLVNPVYDDESSSIISESADEAFEVSKNKEDFDVSKYKGNWKDVNIMKLFHVAKLNFIPKELSIYLSQLPVPVLDSLNKSIGNIHNTVKSTTQNEIVVQPGDGFSLNVNLKKKSAAAMEVYSQKGISIFRNKKPIEFVSENQSFEISIPQIRNRVSVDKNKRDSRVSLTKKVSIDSNSLTKKDRKIKERSASVEPKLLAKTTKTNQKVSKSSSLIESRGNSPNHDLNSSFASSTRQSPKKVVKSRKTKGK